MRHPRVIIVGLGLALPIAAPPAGTAPAAPAGGTPGSDTARHPGGTLTITGDKRAT